MSGPYRFQPDSSRSPLDRRPQNPLPAQPVSFKTNVNRSKTKKWVEAKKNAYDGDDWGDYDEYDEYGAAEQEQEPPPAPAPHPRAHGQPLGQPFDHPGRSFTDPQRQGYAAPSVRRNSFEAGEERAFYASATHPPYQAPGHQPPRMPPPLITPVSPGSAVATAPPSAPFPPRKSSIGQADSPAGTSPRDPAPSNSGKPLPFIRPADIYKRFEEEKRERERASLDEQRPNVESTPHSSNSPSLEQQPLPLVPEAISTSNDHFRSVVDQAFTRADDQRSVPPTPIAKPDSSVSRSDTSSTSGISPIMSRVPSSATSTLKAMNAVGGHGSTPVIAEEASESNTPVSRPTSATLLPGGTRQIPRKASPGHSRNVSSTSLPSSGLTTPNAAGSPARSPIIKPQAHVPEPETAQVSSLDHSPEISKAALPSNSTIREADIAEAMRLSPVKAQPELSVAEKESQTAFLDNHPTSTPIADAVPRSRSESPSKGRVQELAGKFGDVSHSRRGSTQSNASRTSLQSWERSGESSRPTSPTKPVSPSRDNLDPRPTAEREASFRPKLPGQWESYATSSTSPNTELGTDSIPATHNQEPLPLGDVDLTPTTAKRSAAPVHPSKSDSDHLASPLAALKAAGAAVGEAVQTSIGFGSSSAEETGHEQTHGSVLPRPLQFYREESFVSTTPPTPSGQGTPRSENVPPIPPTEDNNTIPRPSTLSSTPPERPAMMPQLSTDMTDDDQESDRLRKEIVASLTPQSTIAGSAAENSPTGLHAGTDPLHRESSLFPREYDSYWADGDRESPRLSYDHGQNGDGQMHLNADNAITPTSPINSFDNATKPSTLSRFSWEEGKGSGLVINKLQQFSRTADSEDGTRVETEKMISSPMIERAKQEQGAGESPEPYFGPMHDVASVKPEPISEFDSEKHPSAMLGPTPISNLPQSVTDQPSSPTAGLHVVNSALNPEAVDMPPRLSREVSPTPDQARSSQDMVALDPSASDQDPAKGLPSNPAISAPLHGLQEPAAISATATASSTSDKPLGFKDILQIKSTAERINSYDKTRDYWAHVDHGLVDWVSSAFEKNPDLATQSYPQPRPVLNTSGTLRHRPTGSISLFGKHHSSNASPAEAFSNSSQTPTTPTSAPMFQGSGRSASHQMQAKGKDLLHTAGLLSGKGMTGAKGLFAKGKSRFKSDKATSESEPSSREASEEPSDMGSTASDTLAGISLDTRNTSKGERDKRHKRHFSSPFHRTSRSRSRPNSIILPSIETTPRSTPGNSRPQSYHPPEIWNAGPSALSSTPPTPERLGVLPSPAKGAFSWKEMAHGGELPPMPPIPSDMDLSHRLLQSVIRHSTPPAGELGTLEESPPSSAAENTGSGGLHGGVVGPNLAEAALLDRGAWDGDEEQMVEPKGSEGSSRDGHDGEGDEDQDESCQLDDSGRPVPPRRAASVAKPSRLPDGGQHGAEDVGPHQSPHEAQQKFNDVSPMIAAATLPSDISDSSDDGHATATAQVQDVNVVFSYETELIGSDLSPMSSSASSSSASLKPCDDDEETRTREHRIVVRVVEAAAAAPSSLSPSRDQAPVAGGDALEHAPRPKPQQQLSAYRVVHAVEYLHSQSSFESLAPSQPSQPDDGLDEVDTPPGRPQQQQQQQQQQQEEEEEEEKKKPALMRLMAAPAPPDPAVPIKSDTPHQDDEDEHQRVGPQQSPDLAKPHVHKRSESLISKISSMVSADDAPISPVSSNHLPRSRPPSAQARRRQIPSAKTSPIPVQIKEEPNPSDRAIDHAIDNHDFDLYADHNGLVKGVEDDEGRPLRLATDHPLASPASSPPVPLAQSKPAQSKPVPSSASMEEAAVRYSDERPMSFVWGPRDANGRPQDEINRPGAPVSDTPPPLPNTRVQRSSQPSHGPAPNTKMQRPRAHSNTRLLEQPSQPDRSSKNVSPLSSYRESSKSSPHTNISPPPTTSTSPPQQEPSSPNKSDISKVPNGGQEQTSPPTSPDPRLVQDPRVMMEAQMRGWLPGHPPSQDSSSRPQLPGQGPQMPGNMLAAARNQYEYQQMMARQAMQTPELKSSLANPQPTKKDDRSFKPRLSSVFKGLGKSSSSAQPAPLAPSQPPLQQAPQPQGRSHLPMSAAAENARRSASLQSGVSDLSYTQMAPSVKERRAPGLASAFNRPPSVGQESHISQESTRVQVTDSRLNLRYPTSPPPSQGAPQQQPPPHTFQTISNLPKPQNYRDYASQMPETGGKKKRFSSLGNIFNRGLTTVAASPNKTKMSKEEKKSQKAQKHSSAIPPQSTSQDHAWPPQQSINPLRYGGVQHGAPPVLKSFPGMQSVPLQPMQQQTASTPSQQHVQQQSIPSALSRNGHDHGVPQQYMQSPGSQALSQVPPSYVLPQSQRSPNVSEGSAYMDTRHVVHIHAQRMHEQNRLPAQQSSQPFQPDPAFAAPISYQSRQHPEGLASPPINEYFKPDLKTTKPLPPIQQQQPAQESQIHPHPPHQHRQQQQQMQQQASVVPQEPSNPHSVSTPVVVPAIDQIPRAAHAQVASPAEEPLYETPPIPGAYTHVSGAFVSPRFEEYASHNESPEPTHHYDHEYSDPQMQPISPQVSAMTTSPPNLRHNSSDSVVSPILNTLSGTLPQTSPPPNSRPQKQRMSSITEQVQSERPWILDLPQGATEQEIVRARQRQYMEQQLLAQEQLHAERTGRSPSPRSGQSNQSASPPPPPTEERPPQRESGGFRELLPRSSPQPYPIASQQPVERLGAPRPHSPSPPIAPAPVHPALVHNPATYPLPISPGPTNATSPINPMMGMMPPPPLPTNLPHTSMSSALSNSRTSRPTSQDAASDHTRDSLYDPPPPPTEHYQQPEYDDLPPADQPPPYSGPGVPNEGMEKERPRPPNIVTDTSDRGRNFESRQRQASLGLLQHPQPASMAASPQRSSADMGADILRRQLLEAEERERQERLHRAEIQRQESARERQERERARARARELERSISGGGRVGSLRSPAGSTRTNTNGFERSGSTSRPVYELPAEEDDEPVMRATSFPGQEWVPTWMED